MPVLVIDTASVYCAAGIVENGCILGSIREEIYKGHAEYLMGQIAAVLEEAHSNIIDINRISVNIGPGSFTGVRVGISAARGLALALSRPAVGISLFEALAFEAQKHARKRPVSVILEASNNTFYVQHFDEDKRKISDARIDTAQAISENLPENAVLTGSGAQKIARISDCTFVETDSTASIQTLALLSAEKTSDNGPLPLYMRSPDAKRQNSFALPRA